MQISIVSTGATTQYHPPAGYRWKLISATASVTGTATDDSVVTFSLRRLDQSSNNLILLTVTSTSTVLTVFGALETAGAANSVLYHPIVMTAADYIYVNVTNNGSVNWTLTFEESPEDA